MRSLVLGFFITAIAGAAACGEPSIGTGGAGTTSTGTSSTSSGGGAGGGLTSSSSGSSSSSSGASSSSASSSSGAGGAGGATSSSSSGDAGSPAHGDCLVDADCPGGACVEVTAGGFRVCATPPEKATLCASTLGLDQCCDSVPCPNGEPCRVGPLVPICAGVPIEPYNQCAADQCTQDADCAPGQICGPVGALGLAIRACLGAGCKLDADCTAAPGGVCAPVLEPCCNTVAGLSCVYPSGGCRSSADCQSGESCQILADRATCAPGAPVCPQ